MGELTVGIVGGGILGLAVGREVSLRRPGVSVVVLEKEQHLATHQTSRNSGVVHAGIYYAPGSTKAELCARGRRLMRDYCVERGLPYVECGKLVVAVDRSEVGRLDALEAKATANGVPGLRRLDGAAIRDVEPYAAGLAALHSPETAITDYGVVARSLAVDIEQAGGRILRGAEVTAIRRTAGTIVVRAAGAEHRLDRVVVCAGLEADRVSRLGDGHDGPRIVPFRGEYLRVTEAKQDFVRGMVYPVPDPRYPFLGVHFTRRVNGDLEVGPNAVLALDRRGDSWRDVALADVRDMVSWPGFWRMGRQHWRTGVTELRGSLSLSGYMERATRYVPAISTADVVRWRSGTRAQAVDRAGSLVDDFHIGHEDGITTVRNAPSPAATSSLAIAEHIVAGLDL